MAGRAQVSTQEAGANLGTNIPFVDFVYRAWEKSSTTKY
jgi:hypothetical protein